MSRSTPALRNFAERLIAYETGQHSPSKTLTPGATLVGMKLRPHLTVLMGSVGFAALLSRALVLAGQEYSWLQPLKVNADGSFAGLDGIKAQMEPEELLEGWVALIAQFLGLLVAFIGEELTIQLIGDLYPKVSLKNIYLSEGHTHEKVNARS